MPNVKEKQGYKFTEEFGYIPEDWDVTSLGNIANIKRGASPRPIDSPVWFDSNSNVGWTRISDIKGKYLFSTEQRLSELGIKNSRYVGADNVIMSICATLGRPTIVKNPICIHDGFVCFFDLNQNFEYLYYVLEFIQDSWLTRGQVGSQSNLNTDLINSTIVLLPTLPEQEKIAEVLSDVDELIESTQKLIDKKNDLKTAAMQKLLTPKTNWAKKLLKGICNRITTGKLDANTMVKNGTYRFYTCAKDYYYIDTYAFEGESLLISGNGVNVGYIHYYNGKFNAYQRTYVLQEFDQDVIYIKHFLDKHLSDRIAKEVLTGNTPYIKLNTLTDMEISFPRDLIEQKQIAKILSDMDSEIEALEKELNKYKDLKTGMMQELLTGKKRLV